MRSLARTKSSHGGTFGVRGVSHLLLGAKWNLDGLQKLGNVRVPVPVPVSVLA
jgi:hypothetical protein